jgi:glucose-1-phosphate thymidylyltransferase
VGRGYAWLSTGTPDSLLEVGDFVGTLQRCQGIKIACPEEIAVRSGFIDRNQLETFGKTPGKSEYGRYLLNLGYLPRR